MEKGSSTANRNSPFGQALAGILLALSLMVLAPGAAAAAVFPVTKTADTADGTCDADCSLREAVVAANANSESDRIELPAGTYTLTLPGADEDSGATGDLDHNENDLEIRGLGSGPGAVEIDASGLGDRIIDLLGGDLRLLNLTLSGGSVSGTLDDEGGAIRSVRELTIRDVVFDQNSAERGGAIHSGATTSRATIEDSEFTGNTATNGGAIFNEDESTIAITRSVFSGNVVTNRGGAVYNQNDGAVTLVDSSFGGNEATADGGAIFHQNTSSLALFGGTLTGNEAGEAGGAMFIQNDSATTIYGTTIDDNEALGTGSSDGGGALYLNNDSAVLIERSTISNNSSAGDAGAISRNNDGQLLMVNSTVSGNSAGGNGGGLIFDSNGGGSFIAVESSTIANNTADGMGGGIYNEGLPELEAGLERTIIADNLAGGVANDCDLDGGADFDSNGGNLDSTGTCGLGGEDISGGDAGLGPLADNGGGTETHALLTGSDAIDAVAGPCPSPATDQRGTARPQGDGCDTGSYELVPEPTDPIEPPDTTPPALVIDGKKKQKVKRTVVVKAKVGCDEQCIVEGSGRVIVKVGKGKRKSYQLKPGSRELGAGSAKNLKLEVRGKKQAKKAKRAIKRAGKGKAKLEFNAMDPSGNEASGTLGIKLRG